MSVLSAQTIRKLGLIDPCLDRGVQHGMSYGLSACGYDLRLNENVSIESGYFELASTMERFNLSNNVMGVIHDKSSWARRGMFVQNTVLEPGWCGYLTLELSYHKRFYSSGSTSSLTILAGTPVAQVIFHFLDELTELPYTGKYQNQRSGPVPAIFEEPSKD